MILKRSALVFAALISTTVQAGPCNAILENDKLTSCLADEFQAADARLNQNYGAARKRLGKELLGLLQKSQRAWLIVRDSDCEIQASLADGGQAYQPLYLSCQTVKTLRRVEELNNLAP